MYPPEANISQEIIAVANLTKNYVLKQ